MSGPLDIHLVDHGSSEYRETVDLRFRILRKPLGLSFTPEQLAAESSDLHMAAFSDGRLIGCLVMTPLESTVIKMRQVAVVEELRGRGIGGEMVRCAEAAAAKRGYTLMTLSARDTAVPFYLKLGYDLVGDPYEEVTIPHRKMQKPISAGPQGYYDV